MSSSASSHGGSKHYSGGSFGNFLRWIAVVFGLSVLSLIVTSSYNSLLSASVLRPTEPVVHQRSHGSAVHERTPSTSDHNTSIILLMSFPNSGTSYTLLNTQTISNLTIATSYDQEIIYPGPPLFVGAHERSPFILNASLGRPRNILTKTHCVGHCEVCVPDTNLQTFQRECLSLTVTRPGQRPRRVPYGTIPYKAVHLFRNPFDNLVARMHLGVQRRRDKLKWEEHSLQNFTYDPRGFRAWCSYLDGILRVDLRQLLRQRGVAEDVLEGLPCLSEWWRYVHWHNQAIDMLQSLKVPTMVMYYEEYTDNYQKAVDTLFEFLELDQVLPPAPFITGKTYETYYTDHEKRLAAQLVEKLASPLCWQIVRDYLEQYTTGGQELQEERQMENESADDDEEEDDDMSSSSSSSSSEEDIGIPTTQVADDDQPVVALLVSFPNSGTSYTLKNTMITSHFSVATNYEQEVKNSRRPLRPDLGRSPYILKPEFELPHYVLTKTHCSGYCEQCEPTELDEFEYHCLVRTRSIEAGKAYERLPYARDLVKKAIHLFRDPFDNLVARMHLGIDLRSRVKHWNEEQLSVFTDTPAGMKAWCAEVDGVFRGDFDELMRRRGVPVRLYETLPCKTDWYRYVMWHNRAIELIERWNVPSLVVHYEDYTARYNDTVGKILDFLELEPARANYPFYSGKTYRSLYDDETGRKAAAFAKFVASPQCWNHIRHYFAAYEEPDSEWEKIKDQALSGRKLVWLLSYPNSVSERVLRLSADTIFSSFSAGNDWLDRKGTSYTIRNTEQMTNLSTATNHGQEAPDLIPVRPDLAGSPFVHKPNMLLPSQVLTKTHCTGYNFQDGPASSLDAFQSKCLTATWTAAGKGLAKISYEKELVAKAVHLVRSPWDNMVSRMHHAIKNAAKMRLSNSFISSITTSDTRNNLKTWCGYVDGLLPLAVRNNLDKEVGELSQIPCHADLLRYVWWHNWALEMTDSLAIPVHVLYYERYSSNHSETVRELNSFLGQQPRRQPLFFEEGKSYLDHFDSEYLKVASKFIASIASDMTSSLIHHYLFSEKEATSAFLPAPQQTRKIVWLLSFPNSGTSYTITTVQRMSNTSAASNYLTETQSEKPVPVRQDLSSGPFLLKPERHVPRLVLTKTHCAGYCDSCGASVFPNTAASFEYACREIHGQDASDPVQYDEMPAKVVHLFRDLFDNLVARKHLGMEIRVAKDKTLAQSKMNEDSPEGFLAWCSYIDQVSATEGTLASFLTPDQLALAQDVPCVYELFRYVQWHNLALEMTDELGIPVHFLYYEDYGLEYNKTVGNLFDFLEIPAVGPSIEFKSGRSYGDHFSPEHARAMTRFAHSIASEHCWRHISRYLDKWLESDGATALQDQPLPKIAWLMSFPNSGTSYTLENTAAMTGSAVGSNYANEVNHTVVIRPDLEHSPFILDPSLPTKNIVLTKTHCSPKDDYASFLAGCRSIRSNQKNTFSPRLYSTELVDKVVHLIRDPFDNIVARMHHGLANREDPAFPQSHANVTDSKALFRSWCTHIDRKYQIFGRNKKWISAAASDLFAQVPCYTDVLHYVAWHNLALQVIEQEAFHAFHLYYEDYDVQLYRATDHLYSRFLGLPVTGQPVKFFSNKSYRNYYTASESLALGKLVREVASLKTWSLIRHYFSDWLDVLEGEVIAPAAWPGQNDNTSIAWLLSFPNSGTTFTITNTEKLTNFTTADNYGRAIDTCVPVRSGLSEGPFINDLNLQVPPVVLTKTHCGGYCDDCSLNRSFLTLQSFEIGCGSGVKRVGHRYSGSRYPSSLPDRVVHLVRDPIDNIVSRMHHGQKRRKIVFGWSNEQLEAFSHSREGVLRWCSMIDENFWDDQAVQAGWVPESIRSLMSYVPCAADFFRYAQWHNLATDMINRLGLPSHILHYEDYSSDFNGTSNALLDFLDLSWIGAPSEFISGKTYRDFFNDTEIEAIGQLIRALVSEPSWNHLQRYFNDMLVSPAIEQRSTSTSISPKIVWLMSFPNSGTSYTITNIKEITLKATATNYLEGEIMKFKPLYPDHAEGPFVKEPFYPLPEYILTKTHCEGYCDMCNQETTRQTVESFEDGCASGTRWVNGEKESVRYSSDLPKKAIHLIRSPFDNIVARMHLGIEKRRKGGWSEKSLSNFNDTSGGVLSWCEHVDERFQANARRPLFAGQKELFSQLPCHSEWFRYVQWHNLAIQTIQRLNLPSLTMFYESYSANYDQTLRTLLDFLELEAVNSPKEFIMGKTYRHLFQPNHVDAAFKFVKTYATEACWNLLRHYFNQSLPEAQ